VRFMCRTRARSRAFTRSRHAGSMDPHERSDVQPEAFDDDEFDPKPEELFDWALFEAWEARSADDPTSLWSLEE
jgi:hypothetical protein